MKAKAIIILMVLILSGNFSNYITAQQKKQTKIQLAILIDTSNSMDGLIEQAKTQLWKIVNEMALARYSGEIPVLEIALYEYGNDRLPSEGGYLRLVAELTTDLDKISEDLFALTTYGGYEYCGAVVKKATDELKWSTSNDDLKMIFIAGNEEFTQGNISYETSCKDAISKGIIVNTIFCGDINEGIRTQWKNAADLADGKYMNIDQNQVIVQIATPFDAEIVELSDKLSNTYVAYGSVGKMKKERQVQQDENVKSLGSGTTVQRAVSKTTSNYNNSDWDLVEAITEGEADISKVAVEDLPEEMKSMDEKQRKEYVEKKSKERTDIQNKINDLNTQRDKFLLEKKKEMSQENTLDAVLVKAIREQAETKNYNFVK